MASSYNFPILLIGMMGSGKTTIGRNLSKILHKEFIDLDHELELDYGKSISEIFKQEGERFFRQKESLFLEKIIYKHNTVVATGGGIVILSKNRDILKKHGVVVYLRANTNEIYQRTKKDRKRPLLDTYDPYNTIEKLISFREKLYRESADLILDTNFISVNNLVKSLLMTLKTYKKIK